MIFLAACGGETPPAPLPVTPGESPQVEAATPPRPEARKEVTPAVVPSPTPAASPSPSPTPEPETPPEAPAAPTKPSPSPSPAAKSAPSKPVRSAKGGTVEPLRAAMLDRMKAVQLRWERATKLKPVDLGATKLARIDVAACEAIERRIAANYGRDLRSIEFRGGSAYATLCKHHVGLPGMTPEFEARYLKIETGEAKLTNAFGRKASRVLVVTRLFAEGIRDRKTVTLLDDKHRVIETATFVSLSDSKASEGSFRLNAPVETEVESFDVEGNSFLNRYSAPGQPVQDMQAFTSADGTVFKSFTRAARTRADSARPDRPKRILYYGMAAHKDWKDFSMVPTFSSFLSGFYGYDGFVADRPMQRNHLEIIEVEGKEVCVEGSTIRENASEIVATDYLQPGQAAEDCFNKW
jgi:hypothetical protein